ncbi:hypothetical protein J6590_008481 [Homalodisca vitripennis]|nr:hypothetical protein J6590_008481 [Homalodisca vitripennis]
MSPHVDAALFVYCQRYSLGLFVNCVWGVYSRLSPPASNTFALPMFIYPTYVIFPETPILDPIHSRRFAGEGLYRSNVTVGEQNVPKSRAMEGAHSPKGRAKLGGTSVSASPRAELFVAAWTTCYGAPSLARSSLEQQTTLKRKRSAQ